MKSLFVTLLTVAALMLALPTESWSEETTAPVETTVVEASTQEEEVAPTLAQTLSDLGLELSEEEAAGVAAYDSSGSYDWTEADLGKGIIGKISEKVDNTRFITDNLWLMICAALVFIMHLGFATLESGLIRSKNTTNVLFKNVMIVCIGLLTYTFIGFNFMYPCGNWAIDGVFANIVPGIGIGDFLNDPAIYLANMTDSYAGYTWWTDFLFQGMFAATAATIVSGCVAERIKLGPFLLFATIYVGFLYPLVGSWKWGAGWLDGMGFVDFAGSTLVHSVGGWGGLAAILVLGPRLGKFAKDGGVRPVLGHNLPLATIGVFLLWLGWFGFNGGSVLNASPATVSYVLVTTSLAAAAGGFAAAMVSWVMTKKPDLTMALNGVLAGLVSITAGADILSLPWALFAGLSGGVIVYFAVIFFDKIKIDDPVGALSVHLVCGIWGTLLCVAGGADLMVQITGIVAYGVTSFVFALVLALVIKAIMGWRVSEEEEREGLDIGEHGQPAYHSLEEIR